MVARVVVMAGGTGGHVFPALAVASELRARGAEVSWLGTRQGLEARLVPERGFPMDWIQVEGLRSSGAKRWLQAPWRLGKALIAAAGVLRRRRPGAVLGMGGFVAGPGGLVARLMGMPLVIHEQNRIPGLTNRWLSRLATRVFEAFPGSFPAGRDAETCGNPVRPEIAALPAPGVRLAGRPGPVRLLVLGGSLGALALNELLPKALALMPLEDRPQVRHQAGERTLSAALEGYRAAAVTAEVVPFIADMAEAYGWADLALCRAGALTVSELAAAGLGAVLVPYPHAVDDHQSANARYLAEAGAARLAPQGGLTAQGLADLLAGLCADRGGLVRMAEAARGVARTDAAVRIADACLELSRHE